MIKNEHEILKRIVVYIRNNPDKLISIGELSEIGGVSERHLQRLFRYNMGCCITNYCDDVKINYLKKLFDKENGKLNIAYFYAQELGYQSESGLHKLVERKTGKTFSEFRDSYKKQRKMFE